MAEKNYKSFEQKFWEFIIEPFKPLGPIIKSMPVFIKSTYGTVVTPLRIPTFVRKIKNNQELLHRVGRDGLSENIFAYSLGFVSGGILIFKGLKYIIERAQSSDYLPLLTVLGTNALSGSYEVMKKIVKNSKEKKLENIIT